MIAHPAIYCVVLGHGSGGLGAPVLTIPIKLDEQACFSWETMLGWEGVDVWRTRMNDDPTVTEAFALAKFPLGTLLEGTDVFGRRVNKLTVLQDENSAQALIMVHWYTFNAYSAS